MNKQIDASIDEKTFVSRKRNLILFEPISCLRTHPAPFTCGHYDLRRPVDVCPRTEETEREAHGPRCVRIWDSESADHVRHRSALATGARKTTQCVDQATRWGHLSLTDLYLKSLKSWHSLSLAPLKQADAELKRPVSSTDRFTAPASTPSKLTYGGSVYRNYIVKWVQEMRLHVKCWAGDGSDRLGLDKWAGRASK